MCYICLKDNPFDMAEAFAQRYASKDVSRVQAKAIFIKQALKAFDQAPDAKCDVGEGTVERLREEQYKIAREL